MGYGGVTEVALNDCSPKGGTRSLTFWTAFTFQDAANGERPSRSYGPTMRTLDETARPVRPVPILTAFSDATGATLIRSACKRIEEEEAAEKQFSRMSSRVLRHPLTILLVGTIFVC